MTDETPTAARLVADLWRCSEQLDEQESTLAGVLYVVGKALADDPAMSGRALAAAVVRFVEIAAPEDDTP